MAPAILYPHSLSPSRCPRLDCSTMAGNQDAAQARVSSLLNQASRGFVASESILSPISKPSNESLAAKLAETTNSWLGERCDFMLELKFDWLLKLCWILAGLLLLTFLVAFYLCLNLNKSQAQRRQPQREDSTNKSTRSSKKILYSHSDPAEKSSWSAEMQAGEELNDDIGQDGTTKQHQQMLFTNVVPEDFSTREANISKQEQSLRGRSIESFGRSQRREMQALVKRRRSIGSANLATLPHEFQQRSSHQNHVGGKLDAGQKLKSRSQTTIYYEQGQDPFKTMPFSYINNGYMSDSTLSQHVYLGANSGAVDVYGIAPQPQQFTNLRHQSFQSPQNNTICQSIPLDNQFSAPQQLALRQDISRQPRWSNLKSNLVAPPLNTDSNNNQSRKQPSSQFDPQNSRQLIDLIQHKHRQQIALAASIQPNSYASHQSQPNMNYQRAWR